MLGLLTGSRATPALLDEGLSANLDLEVPPDLESTLSRLLHRCLRLVPAERPEIGAVHRELDAIVRDLERAAPAASSDRARPVAAAGSLFSTDPARAPAACVSLVPAQRCDDRGGAPLDGAAPTSTHGRGARDPRARRHEAQPSHRAVGRRLGHPHPRPASARLCARGFLACSRSWLSSRGPAGTTAIPPSSPLPPRKRRTPPRPRHPLRRRLPTRKASTTSPRRGPGSIGRGHLRRNHSSKKHRRPSPSRTTRQSHAPRLLNPTTDGSAPDAGRRVLI